MFGKKQQPKEEESVYSESDFSEYTENNSEVLDELPDRPPAKGAPPGKGPPPPPSKKPPPPPPPPSKKPPPPPPSKKPPPPPPSKKPPPPPPKKESEPKKKFSVGSKASKQSAKSQRKKSKRSSESSEDGSDSDSSSKSSSTGSDEQEKPKEEYYYCRCAKYQRRADDKQKVAYRSTQHDKEYHGKPVYMFSGLGKALNKFQRINCDCSPDLPYLFRPGMLSTRRSCFSPFREQLLKHISSKKHLVGIQELNNMYKSLHFQNAVHKTNFNKPMHTRHFNDKVMKNEYHGKVLSGHDISQSPSEKLLANVMTAIQMHLSRKKQKHLEQTSKPKRLLDHENVMKHKKDGPHGENVNLIIGNLLNKMRPSKVQNVNAVKNAFSKPNDYRVMLMPISPGSNVVVQPPVPMLQNIQSRFPVRGIAPHPGHPMPYSPLRPPQFHQPIFYPPPLSPALQFSNNGYPCPCPTFSHFQPNTSKSNSVRYSGTRNCCQPVENNKRLNPQIYRMPSRGNQNFQQRWQNENYLKNPKCQLPNKNNPNTQKLLKMLNDFKKWRSPTPVDEADEDEKMINDQLSVQRMAIEALNLKNKQLDKLAEKYRRFLVDPLCGNAVNKGKSIQKINGDIAKQLIKALMKTSLTKTFQRAGKNIDLSNYQLNNNKGLRRQISLDDPNEEKFSVHEINGIDEKISHIFLKNRNELEKLKLLQLDLNSNQQICKDCGDFTSILAYLLRQNFENDSENRELQEKLEIIWQAVQKEIERDTNNNGKTLHKTLIFNEQKMENQNTNQNLNKGHNSKKISFARGQKLARSNLKQVHPTRITSSMLNKIPTKLLRQIKKCIDSTLIKSRYENGIINPSFVKKTHYDNRDDDLRVDDDDDMKCDAQINRQTFDLILQSLANEIEHDVQRKRRLKKHRHHFLEDSSDDDSLPLDMPHRDRYQHKKLNLRKDYFESDDSLGFDSNISAHEYKYSDPLSKRKIKNYHNLECYRDKIPRSSKYPTHHRPKRKNHYRYRQNSANTNVSSGKSESVESELPSNINEPLKKASKESDEYYEEESSSDLSESSTDVMSIHSKKRIEEDDASDTGREEKSQPLSISGSHMSTKSKKSTKSKSDSMRSVHPSAVKSDMSFSTNEQKEQQKANCKSCQKQPSNLSKKSGIQSSKPRKVSLGLEPAEMPGPKEESSGSFKESINHESLKSVRQMGDSQENKRNSLREKSQKSLKDKSQKSLKERSQKSLKERSQKSLKERSQKSLKDLKSQKSLKERSQKSLKNLRNNGKSSGRKLESPSSFKDRKISGGNKKNSDHRPLESFHSKRSNISERVVRYHNPSPMKTNGQKEVSDDSEYEVNVHSTKSIKNVESSSSEFSESSYSSDDNGATSQKYLKQPSKKTFSKHGQSSVGQKRKDLSEQRLSHQHSARLSDHKGRVRTGRHRNGQERNQRHQTEMEHENEMSDEPKHLVFSQIEVKKSKPLCRCICEACEAANEEECRSCQCSGPPPQMFFRSQLCCRRRSCCNPCALSEKSFVPRSSYKGEESMNARYFDSLSDRTYSVSPSSLPSPPHCQPPLPQPPLPPPPLPNYQQQQIQYQQPAPEQLQYFHQQPQQTLQHQQFQPPSPPPSQLLQQQLPPPQQQQQQHQQLPQTPSQPQPQQMQRSPSCTAFGCYQLDQGFLRSLHRHCTTNQYDDQGYQGYYLNADPVLRCSNNYSNYFPSTRQQFIGDVGSNNHANIEGDLFMHDKVNNKKTKLQLFINMKYLPTNMWEIEQ